MEILFFMIEMDEERIREDGVINLAGVYQCIEDTFAQRDVSLNEKRGAVRYYTRNIDKNDYAYLRHMNLLFEKEAWFLYYIKTGQFLMTNDRTGVIEAEEDLLEELWVELGGGPASILRKGAGRHHINLPPE